MAFHQGETGLFIDDLAQNSPLGRAHPGVKVVFSLVMLLLCIGFDTLPTSLFIGGTMMVAMVTLCGIPLGKLMRLMAIPLAFLTLSCVTILVQVSWDGGLKFFTTTSAVEDAIHLFFKAYGGITCLYFLNVTTTVERLITLLGQWRCPAILLELMYLIYRYLFVLLDVLRRMIISAHARLGYRTYRRSWYTFTHMGGNLLAQSFRKSSAIFDAMEGRLYQGTLAFYERPVVYEKKYALYAVAWVAVTSLVGVLVWMHY